MGVFLANAWTLSCWRVSENSELQTSHNQRIRQLLYLTHKPTCTNVLTADPYESVFILLHLLSRLMLCLWIVCTIKENSRHCASPYLSEPYDDLTCSPVYFSAKAECESSATIEIQIQA